MLSLAFGIFSIRYNVTPRHLVAVTTTMHIALQGGLETSAVQHGAGNPGKDGGEHQRRTKRRGRQGGGMSLSLDPKTVRDTVFRLHPADLYVTGLQRFPGLPVRHFAGRGEGVCAAAEQKRVGRSRRAAPVPGSGVQPKAPAVP